MFKAEFDVYGNPPKTARVELKENGLAASVVLVINGEEEELLGISRDQWGVWFYSKENVIAQEDGTRSFLDALIKTLQEVKENYECDCSSSTVTKED